MRPSDQWSSQDRKSRGAPTHWGILQLGVGTGRPGMGSAPYAQLFCVHGADCLLDGHRLARTLFVMPSARVDTETAGTWMRTF